MVQKLLSDISKNYIKSSIIMFSSFSIYRTEEQRQTSLVTIDTGFRYLDSGIFIIYTKIISYYIILFVLFNQWRFFYYYYFQSKRLEELF